MNRILTHSQLLQLKRWNTPTIYNGWELITQEDRTQWMNIEETQDFMPHMGPMVGYAVTVKIEPSNPLHKERKDAWEAYRSYVSSIPGPKIVVVEDLDKPQVIGSFWGEVNANVHRAQGCVGTITDGAIRDWDEMCNAGFKALASRFCVGHAYVHPIEWGVEVEVFGRKIQPGQLIHADKHGFLLIPEADQAQLLEASIFMDQNECNTVIRAARESAGKSPSELLDDIRRASKAFGENARAFGGRSGEW